MHGRSRNALIRHLVATAHSLRDRFTAELTASRTTLREAHRSLADTLQREVPRHEVADTLAQSAACAAPILADGPAPDWLLNQLAAWERFALDEAAVLAPTLPRSPSPTPRSALRIPHLFEPFLHAYSATTRKRRGVFFTPEPIARFIVSQIDLLLRTDFKLPSGLASKSQIPNPKSQILLLDPACGTGVFLLAALDHIHRTFTADCTIDSADESDRSHRWNALIDDLLPRLIGIEILPPAAFLTKLNLTQKLVATGYNFRSPIPLQIHTADALSPDIQSQIGAPALAGHPKSQIPVLLGNPPFSSLSTTTNPWIARLVRGEGDIRGYVQANGQRLGERKTWLHDDYVKFIRLAQWHIEQAGCGIIGFVTNHGYLDNATFRLMRQELLRVFERIHIIDLHGNRKKHEVAPGAARDENLLHLDQGLAISLFARGVGVPPALPIQSEESTPTRSVSAGQATNPKSQIPNRGARDSGSSCLLHLDLWGTRDSKLAALTDPSLALRACEVVPQAPHFRFAPAHTVAVPPEYTAAWSLADAMPVNTPAPVTARDHFVVAFTREALEQRIAEFRDFAIPDEEIRRRYFTRTRSARYQPGDTRSWKLSAARQIVAADPDWQSKIVRCLYRPFDWRYVFWHAAMIDWPRHEVTRHLLHSSRAESDAESSSFILHPSSLALIARRQQLPTQPCTFFWITDCLALDGVIRSDNRGSESLFPLYSSAGMPRVARVPGLAGLAGVPGVERSSTPAERSFIRDELCISGSPDLRPNFAPRFLADLTARIGRQSSPLETLAYIYALFHSPTYRRRYAAELRTDFPRILLPNSTILFDSLAHLGHQLIDLHLLHPTPHSAPHTPHSALRAPHSPLISDLRPLTSPPEPRTPNPEPSVLAFRAGGYPALDKWLQPPHRAAADPDYARLVRAIEETLAIMPAIDAAVARSGGWEAAFCRS